jgi:hypothetical protein
MEPLFFARTAAASPERLPAVVGAAGRAGDRGDQRGLRDPSQRVRMMPPIIP